ncbi:hypothetical protein BOX24_02125 [Leptospirillum ferriphilum]|uniref:Uncharacterized protein n=1 Tax=Leptospirillum ferriphilum TaxID=178606 RepID=A0A1V3SXS7_9BACT|nr:hypothetical protein BOX24_02125 [Leptospirillum ferriphilum]
MGGHLPRPPDPEEGHSEFLIELPNEDSAIRLIGALLWAFHEQWSTGKKYLDMTEYHEWKKQESFKTSPPLAIVE